MEVKQRILVVDDNLPQRIIHESYLKELGYEVELAEDGFAAMASLKLGIDLIILDLKMPGMDGYEVTKKIRQDPEYFNIPIIVVSSLSSDVEYLRALEAGAKILDGSSSNLLEMGKVIAISHHEKWDGSGYPKGLKGKNISIGGKIVAVADAFDAMTSKRPYKDPFSAEKSFKIIEEAIGKHFDPEIAGEFLEEKNEVLKIAEKYRDDRSH